MSGAISLRTAIVAGIACAAAGSAATWYLVHARLPDGHRTPAEADVRAYRYVSLDKIIVMLRGTEGEPVSHFLAVDLVFKTPQETERVTREQLPLLRSVVVSALSNYTLERVRQMTLEELAGVINAAFTQAYASDRAGKPFTEAMISKLIIE